MKNDCNQNAAPVTLAKRVRWLREQRGQTRGEFAKMIGVSLSLVSLWENEKRTVSVPHLMKMCELVGISMDFMCNSQLLPTFKDPKPPAKPPLPPRFYWKKCYEIGGRLHWSLCDTETDSDAPPDRVTCLEMIVWDHWSVDFDKQRVPALIVELLNAHYAMVWSKRAKMILNP